MNKDLRDVFMFVLGALGFMHELILGPIERPYIIAASCALMGAPLVFNGATRIKNGRNNDGKG